MTVLSDPLMRHEYDMQGTYILKDYNITVSDLYQYSRVLCDFHKVDMPWKDTVLSAPISCRICNTQLV